MLLTIISFILILSVLVFVHELGHFLTARRFGAKAEEFGIGFPPRLFGWYRAKDGSRKRVWGSAEVTDAADTVYSLNWIPVGGFVKIKGENGDDTADTESFAGKPIWQRAIILSAGVIMNVLLAFVLISAILGFGSSQAIDEANLPQGAIIGDRRIQVLQVMSESPAQEAGVRPGDEIVSIDGKTFTAYSQIQDYVADKAGTRLQYMLARGDEEIAKPITPMVLPESGKGGIGISIAETASVRYPWYLAIVEGAKTTVFMIWAIILGFIDLVGRLVTGAGVSADIAGPVGIAALTGQMAELGFGYLVQFAALLSLNLAVINFLPFPALDGGRILFLIIEKIKGRPVRQKTEAIVHNIGFALLIALIAIVTFKDIVRLF